MCVHLPGDAPITLELSKICPAEHNYYSFVLFAFLILMLQTILSK